jgi:RNA polymerase sigma factor (sigma-70 family)
MVFSGDRGMRTTPQPAAQIPSRPTPETDAALAVAAKSGDRRALEALFRNHLPLIYNLVRQTLGGTPDVDDVVQDILLRALRQLPQLRDPASFRPWLTATAVHQIGSHLARTEATAGRTAPLDAAAWQPDAEIEAPALLRVELAGQRRQVRSASRWLSPEDRTLLSLFWLETIGDLSRADVAAALRVSIPHAGVRLQRMREQLELSRTIVAALEAMPGCDELSAVIADWNGVPSPFWRKRIARHTRSCPVCTAAGEGLIPAERLLAGIAALPLPAALEDAAGQAAVGGGAGSTGGITDRLLTTARSHPGVIAAAAGAALVVVVAVTVPSESPPAPPTVAAPVPLAPAAGAPAPPVLPAGRVSLESANLGGRYVAVVRDWGVLAPITGTSSKQARARATFAVRAGLADPDCYSFRTGDGRWLRHSSWRLRPDREQPTVLFRRDATFCARAGATAGTLALESYNYRGFFLRHTGGELWVDQSDDSAKFRSDSSFRLRPPLS